MGYKNTYEIDRATALAVIANNITSCTNEQLEQMLEEFNESEFRNYMVCDHISEDEVTNRIIKSVSDF